MTIIVKKNTSGIVTGAVLPYLGKTSVAGFLLCNGDPVSRVTYGKLFATIGVLYGAGDGTTTFNLPDLRGQFIRSTLTPANVGVFQEDLTRGPVNDFVSSSSVASGGIHSHSGSTNSTGAHSHSIVTDNKSGGGAYPENASASNLTVSSSSAGSHNHTVSVNSTGSHNHTFTLNGGGDSETRPRNLAVSYIIGTGD